MTPITDTPRIYVACLASYNIAILHGAWIDATQEPDAIMAEVQAMLAVSPQPHAEEWAIHDYEYFEGVRLSEWEGFNHVHDIACFIEAHGRLGALLLAYCDEDIQRAATIMDEGYHGQYRNLAEYAEELTEETNSIPELLACYVDYERMGKDMELSGSVFTLETAWDEVHVFSEC